MPPEAESAPQPAGVPGKEIEGSICAVEHAGDFGADRASRRYDRERLQALLRNTLPAQGAHVVVLLVVAWAAHEDVPAMLLAAWCACFIAVALARSLHALWLLRGRREAAPEAMEREYAIGAGIAGSVLGLLAFVTVPSPSSVLAMTGAFAIAGLVLGAFGAMQGSPRAFAAFSTPALALLFAALVLQPGAGPTLGAAAVLAFTLIVKRLYGSLSAGSRSAMRLRFENEVLAADRGSLEASLHAIITEQNLIFEAATVGILLSVDGRVVRCNGSLEQMFGYERGTLEGLGVRVLFESEESWREAEGRISRSLAERGVHEDERVFVRANGTPVRCRFSGRSIDRADAGKGSIWVFFDLSEQDQVEAARTRSESRYELAMSASPAGMWDWDLALDRISYTARFRELLGYSDEAEFRAGFSFRGHLHPDDAERALSAIDRHLAQRAPFRERFRLRCADGSWRWFDASGQAQWDEAGRAVRFAGAIADITDLQELLHENQAIFNAAMVGILVTSERLIQRCNDGLELMFGYAPGELDGAPMRQLYASEADWSDAGAALCQSFSEQGNYRAEQRMCRKDGTLLWCSFSARAIDAGRPDGRVISVVQDITARREAEEALRASVATLREREEALLRAGAELGASNTRLHEAIEAIPDGFALFDTDDRLVLCNQHYKELYLNDAGGGSSLGMNFEQLLRASLAPGGTGTLPASHADGLEGWIAERLRRHREPAPEGYLYRMADGRWMQVRERRTADGGYVGVHSDVTELKTSEEHIRHLANHDALTGLPNRRLLEDRMGQALGLTRRTNSMLAVMVIDLDRFKTVNDTHGHDVGDMVLLTVASRVRSCVREVDTVARLGGDEFVVLLPQLHDAADAMLIAEKIIADVGKPVIIGGLAHQLGASVGISLHPQDGADAEALLRAADDAMYDVKAAGRNGARFHRPGDPAGGTPAPKRLVERRGG